MLLHQRVTTPSRLLLQQSCGHVAPHRVAARRAARDPYGAAHAQLSDHGAARAVSAFDGLLLGG
jgi:hypothetical protein